MNVCWCTPSGRGCSEGRVSKVVSFATHDMQHACGAGVANLDLVPMRPAVPDLVPCRCVCVNSTSGGGRSLATPTYQGRLALVFLPLGAAVTKIRSATLTLPSAQGWPFMRLHPSFPRRNCSTNTWSHAKLQSLSLPSTSAGPAGPCTGRSRPLSVAKSRSIG